MKLAPRWDRPRRPVGSGLTGRGSRGGACRRRTRRPRAGRRWRTRAPIASSSAARPASRSRSSAASSRRLASRTASGPRCGDLLADRVGPARRPGRRARRAWTRPIARRLVRVEDRPVRISSLARARPTTRGRRCVPPAPGVTARRTSGSPSFARSDATRMSHASASSSPPPSALPSIAAIVGIGRSASRRRRPLLELRAARGRRARGGPRTRLTSEPAENARSPLPVTTTARTSPGSAASSVRQRLVQLVEQRRASRG